MKMSGARLATVGGFACLGIAALLSGAWAMRWLDRGAIWWIAPIALAGAALVLLPAIQTARDRAIVAVLLLLLVPGAMTWLGRLTVRVHRPETWGERNARILGLRAPDFSGTDLDGRPFRLSDHRGKVVVIEIWRTWCPPCLEQLPYMQYAHELMAAEGLVVVALSDEPPELQREVKDALGLSFPLVRQGLRMPRLYVQEQSWPQTFIVDRQGVIRHADLARGYGGVVQISREVRGREGALPPPPEARPSTGP